MLVATPTETLLGESLAYLLVYDEKRNHYSWINLDYGIYLESDGGFLHGIATYKEAVRLVKSLETYRVRVVDGVRSCED